MEIGKFIIEYPVLVVFLIFAITLIIQLYFYLFIYSKIIKKPQIKKNAQDIPVSVVICAQNEGRNLIKHLPSILTQDYPDYEVIVVDDCSTDNTADVLSELKLEYPHLKVTYINKDDKFTHGKKLALTVGIKAAKNEWLLLTDADCKPVSNNWIRAMAPNFTSGTSVVLGYGGYFRKKSLLNSIIRYDTLFIGIQYLSLAKKGKPYMGVGRNLAYRKSLFFKNKGFSRHYGILSGDDDIFINEVANKKNTKIEVLPDSLVMSEPQKKWKSWFKQKIRHFQAGFYYNFRSKFRIGLENISRILFYFTFIIILLISKELLVLILGMFMTRMIMQLIIVKYAIVRLNQKNLLLPSLLYDFVLLFFNFIFIIANIFSTDKSKWK